MLASIIKTISNTIAQHGNTNDKQSPSNILSDETAKTAQNVSTDGDADDAETDKLAALKQYGVGVGKGFANAGAIATGKSSVDWKDIDTKAIEDIVKGWRKRDFNKQEKVEEK